MNGELAIQPPFADFSARYLAKSPALLWTRLVADLETPVSAMLKLHQPGEPCFLLESVEGGEVRGRYSIIGLKPDLIWRCFGARAEISSTGSLKPHDFTPCAKDSLTSLRELMAQSRLDIPPELPSMAAGLIGYLGYDMVKLMEKLPDENPDPLALPDACLMRPTVMAILTPWLESSS